GWALAAVLAELLLMEKLPPTLFRFTAVPVVVVTLPRFAVMPLMPPDPARPVFAPEEMLKPLSVSPVASVTVLLMVGVFPEPAATRVTILLPVSNVRSLPWPINFSLAFSVMGPVYVLARSRT